MKSGNGKDNDNDDDLFGDDNEEEDEMVRLWFIQHTCLLNMLAYIFQTDSLLLQTVNYVGKTKQVKLG